MASLTSQLKKVSSRSDLHSFNMATLSSVLIALVLVAVPYVSATEKEIQALQECNKKIGADPSAIEKLLLMQEPLDSTKEGKCLVQCGLSAFGVMKPDGSIDPENSQAYILHAYSKPENREKVLQIWDTCQKSVEKVEDQCEHAYGLIECAIEAANKAKIPMIHEDKNGKH